MLNQQRFPRLQRLESSIERFLDRDHPDRSFPPATHRRCLLFVLVLFAIQISPYWYGPSDGSTYLGMARHVFQDEPFAQPGEFNSAAPPGYPLLISPAFLFGDRPFLAISILNFLFAGCLLIGVYVWTRKIFPRMALLLTTVSMVNMAVLFHYRRTLKEVAFMAVAIWIVLLLDHARQGTRRSAVSAAAAAALLCLAVLIRFSAILFAAGFGLSILLAAYQGKLAYRRGIILILLVGVPASGLLLQIMARQHDQQLTHGGPSYQRAFEKAYAKGQDRLVSGSTEWASSIGRVMIPGMFKTELKSLTDPNLVPYVMVMVIVGVGWCLLIRTGTGDVFALTLPFYVLLHILWPYNQGGRFAVPLLPILMVCYWVGIRRWFPFPKTSFVLAIILHAGVGFGYWLAVDLPHARTAAVHWKQLESVAGSVTEPGLVQSWKNEELTAAMLSVILDRPLYHTDSETLGISSHTAWLILPRSAAVVDGFECRHADDRWEVWRRIPASLPPPLTSRPDDERL